MCEYVAEEKHNNRILIADDDPVSCRMLQFFLLKWGYDVVTAADGTEALRILRAKMPRRSPCWIG